ncbi:MAG: hypothetical protein HY690_17915 [Chloroflexi bacterium]|nr:hypothetical protein [Chloroflexota bacterium]
MHDQAVRLEMERLLRCPDCDAQAKIEQLQAVIGSVVEALDELAPYLAALLRDRPHQVSEEDVCYN